MCYNLYDKLMFLFCVQIHQGIVDKALVAAQSARGAWQKKSTSVQDMLDKSQHERYPGNVFYTPAALRQQFIVALLTRPPKPHKNITLWRCLGSPRVRVQTQDSLTPLPSPAPRAPLPHHPDAASATPRYVSGLRPDLETQFKLATACGKAMTAYCVAFTKDKNAITDEQAAKTIDRSIGMAKTIKDIFWEKSKS